MGCRLVRPELHQAVSGKGQVPAGLVHRQVPLIWFVEHHKLSPHRAGTFKEFRHRPSQEVGDLFLKLGTGSISVYVVGHRAKGPIELAGKGRDILPHFSQKSLDSPGLLKFLHFFLDYPFHMW
jgi:hypothetical protein